MITRGNNTQSYWDAHGQGWIRKDIPHSMRLSKGSCYSKGEEDKGSPRREVLICIGDIQVQQDGRESLGLRTPKGPHNSGYYNDKVMSYQKPTDAGGSFAWYTKQAVPK